MDVYDEAVAHFTAHPEEIYAAWNSPGEEHFGLLFAYSGEHQFDSYYPCPSQIKGGMARDNARIVAKVMSYGELPTDDQMLNLNPSHRGHGDPKEIIPFLPIFAEIQRFIDSLLSRVLPSPE